MTVSFRCQALLFDLDGVLVDSGECIEHVWAEWACHSGLDPAPFLAVAHGRRIGETLKIVMPDLDIPRQVAVLDQLEEQETRGIRPVPGASALLGAIPGDRWGIVTSGSHHVATLRLEVAGLPRPEVFITGDRVRRGKPDPEGYLQAARQLGWSPAECVAFEDTQPGLAAVEAAGMRAVALLTTSSCESLGRPEACVSDLTALQVAVAGDGLTITLIDSNRISPHKPM